MEAFRKFVLVALCLAAAMAARAQLDITLSLPSATVMRFERSRPDELRTAAEEQAKIIRMRLVRLLQQLA